VLLSGATGFVGRAVAVPLERAGWHVRRGTRDVKRARQRTPHADWVALDVDEPASVAAAMQGCDAAVYLVHGMGGHAEDFRRAEVRQAETFRLAAERAGVRRVVYLGGVAAPRDASEHLRSREDVGRVLRAGAVSTVELRASMIIGHGSLSWQIVRDLAARLPVMVLPRWLESRTQPVAIADIVDAIVGALELGQDGSAWHDVPGPEILSGREILERTAAVMGLRPPLMVEVPLLTPRLSSHWVRLVTAADWAVARELVVGLTTDLLARDADYWRRIDHPTLIPFDDAARAALAVERREGPVRGAWGAVERVLVRAPGAVGR
jgi:uncharacterized protein YbjT (DUF2867 family)